MIKTALPRHFIQQTPIEVWAVSTLDSKTTKPRLNDAHWIYSGWQEAHEHLCEAAKLDEESSLGTRSRRYLDDEYSSMRDALELLTQFSEFSQVIDGFEYTLRRMIIREYEMDTMVESTAS